MKTLKLNLKKFFPVTLGVLSIIATVLLILNEKFEIECVDLIFKSVYTLPLINSGIIIASIWLYYSSRKQEGESGSTASIFSLSLLALSNLSFINDLMKMADDINVNQIVTCFMYLAVTVSYIFMSRLIYLTCKKKTRYTIRRLNK
ncbi:TPA: hypothetical protein OTT33_002451 [Proteus mirabilis]|nr:hypothetical protein [Proteus mirabilis]